MKMNVSVFVVRSFRLTIPAVAAVIISACSEPLAPGTIRPSTFPSEVPFSRPAEAVETQRENATFPLLNGSLQAVLPEGGSPVGRIGAGYSGSSSDPIPGRATATLGVRIRQTTGVASGITVVKADGSGAFTGEGEFTLTLSLATAQGETIAVKLRGTSAISSCTDEQPIQVTMRGTGSTPRLGTVNVVLQHEVGNTVCSS